MDADAQHIAMLKHIFEEVIPFNKTLGIQVEFATNELCRIRIPANPAALTGNPARPALHGGVIAAAADAAGGLAVATQLKFGEDVRTVDLRIDYLRGADPRRDLFVDGTVARLGSRIAWADMVAWQDDPSIAIVKAHAVYSRVKPVDKPPTTQQTDALVTDTGDE